MRPKFYDYDYSDYVAKPLDYVDPQAPVNTVTKCIYCGQNLGAQNPSNYHLNCFLTQRK